MKTSAISQSGSASKSAPSGAEVSALREYTRQILERGRGFADELEAAGELQAALGAGLVRQLCHALEAAHSQHPGIWPLSQEQAVEIRALGGDPEFRARLMRLEHLGPDFLHDCDAPPARLPDSPSVPQDEPDPLLKLVPVEPTEEMAERVARIIDPTLSYPWNPGGRTSARIKASAIFAMLNAVPTIPGGGGNE